MPDEHVHPLDPVRVDRARSRVLDVEEASRVAAALAVVADPTRARILHALDLVDELCVGDIALALGATEDSVGYGLRVLRTAGLVSSRKQGRTVFYRLADGVPEPLWEHCLRALVALSRSVRDAAAGG